MFGQETVVSLPLGWGVGNVKLRSDTHTYLVMDEWKRSTEDDFEGGGVPSADGWD